MSWSEVATKSQEMQALVHLDTIFMTRSHPGHLIPFKKVKNQPSVYDVEHLATGQVIAMLPSPVTPNVLSIVSGRKIGLS